MLIVTENFEKDLALAARNLYWTTYIEAGQVNRAALEALAKAGAFSSTPDTSRLCSHKTNH